MLAKKMVQVRDQYLRQLPSYKPGESTETSEDATASLPESGIRQEELLQWYMDTESLKWVPMSGVFHITGRVVHHCNNFATKKCAPQHPADKGRCL